MSIGRKNKAAGGVLTAKQAPRRPGTAPAPVWRHLGDVAPTLPQTEASGESPPRIFSGRHAAGACRRSRRTKRLPVVPTTEVLVELVVDRSLHEADGAVRQGEIRPA